MRSCGFLYVANATTEPSGVVAFLNGRWSNIEKALFKFFTQKGLVIRVFLIFGVRPVNLRRLAFNLKLNCIGHQRKKI